MTATICKNYIQFSSFGTNPEEWRHHHAPEGQFLARQAGDYFRPRNGKPGYVIDPAGLSSLLADMAAGTLISGEKPAVGPFFYRGSNRHNHVDCKSVIKAVEAEYAASKERWGSKVLP
jgi:hypothetical protein